MEHAAFSLSVEVELDSKSLSDPSRECVELWFQGSHNPVTVSADGWFWSTNGARPHGDAHAVFLEHDVSAQRTVVQFSVQYKNKTTGVEFQVKNVCVPFPRRAHTHGTALCVDVVAFEFADTASRARGAPAHVCRRKAFATFWGLGKVSVVALWDVPLIVWPNELALLEHDPHTQPHWHFTAKPENGSHWKERTGEGSGYEWAAGNFTLHRGIATLATARMTFVEAHECENEADAEDASSVKWARPPDFKRMHDEYVDYFEAQQAWIQKAVWDEFGRSACPKSPFLVRNMADIPTWFPSRVSPHVPGAMCVDPKSASPFRATIEWWRRQLREVLCRIRASEEDFLAWRDDDPRAACVAMRVAKLRASCYPFAVDWTIVPSRDGATQVLRENDVYNDMRVSQAGDCDDFALYVYRAFVALTNLPQQEEECPEALKKASRAANAYVPMLCTGLFHHPDLVRAPRAKENLEQAEAREENVHAFVVAFPKSWVQFWLGKATAPDMNVKPLIGDATVWLDPCLDGGARCCKAGLEHTTEDFAERVSLMIRRVYEKKDPLVEPEAIMWPFTEVAGASEVPAVHMHDCVVTCMSAVPADLGWVEEGAYLFQFRQGFEATGSLDAIMGTPEKFKFSVGPTLSKDALELFRCALEYERPVGKLRVSPQRREAMEAISREFQSLLLPCARPTCDAGGHVQHMFLSLDTCMEPYPAVRVANEKWLKRAAEILSESVAAASMYVRHVDGDIGRECLRITLATAPTNAA